MQARLWTLSGLAVELVRDRRSLARDLEGLAPDEVIEFETGKPRDPIANVDWLGGTSEDDEALSEERVSRRWKMARVIAHLYAGERKSVSSLDEERARLAKAQADKLEMELAVRGGELLERTSVMRDVGAMLATFRDRVVSIPDAVGQVLSPRNAQLVVPEVRKRIYEALTEIASYKPNGASEGTGAADEH